MADEETEKPEYKLYRSRPRLLRRNAPGNGALNGLTELRAPHEPAPEYEAQPRPRGLREPDEIPLVADCGTATDVRSAEILTDEEAVVSEAAGREHDAPGSPDPALRLPVADDDAGSLAVLAEHGLHHRTRRTNLDAQLVGDAMKGLD